MNQNHSNTARAANLARHSRGLVNLHRSLIRDAKSKAEREHFQTLGWELWKTFHWGGVVPLTIALHEPDSDPRLTTREPWALQDDMASLYSECTPRGEIRLNLPHYTPDAVVEKLSAIDTNLSLLAGFIARFFSHGNKSNNPSRAHKARRGIRSRRFDYDPLTKL
jgi:hypothetical protein